jgi:hypothetical protein
MSTTLRSSTISVSDDPRQQSNVTINAAFLQDIKEANEQLWRLLHDLHEQCKTPFTIQIHPRRVVILIKHLLDQLAMHFSLEEAFGYFDDPISIAPHLCTRADELRADHQVLFLDLCAIVDQAESLLDHHQYRELTQLFVMRFDSFYEQLKAHEAAENDLMLEALDDDIGVGD